MKATHKRYIDALEAGAADKREPADNSNRVFKLTYDEVVEYWECWRAVNYEISLEEFISSLNESKE